MNANKDFVVHLRSVSFKMKYVQGGTFQMGGTEFDFEQPIHKVSVPSFFIGQYPVTQSLYQAITKQNPSFYKGDTRPVGNVSWDDAKAFIAEINKRPETDSFQGTFRLPTEAEWEYSARGGQYSQSYEYAGSDDVNQVGWHDSNSGDETKPVGLLFPNELGIYDMSGNVWEWCEDDWHSSYDNAPSDGSAWIEAPSRGANRVVRGGNSWDDPVSCRSAYRDRDHPADRFDSLGFRLVFSPV